MAESAQKFSFAQGVANMANAMANLDAAIKDASSLLGNQGWNAGGTDPIIAADIPADAGFTVTDLTNFFTVAARFNNFMNGAALSADANTRGNVDRMRSSYTLGQLK